MDGCCCVLMEGACELGCVCMCVCCVVCVCVLCMHAFMCRNGQKFFSTSEAPVVALLPLPLHPPPPPQPPPPPLHPLPPPPPPPSLHLRLATGTRMCARTSWLAARLDFHQPILKHSAIKPV